MGIEGSWMVDRGGGRRAMDVSCKMLGHGRIELLLWGLSRGNVSFFVMGRGSLGQLGVEAD